MAINLNGKTLTVVYSDESGIIFADISGGWAGLGNAQLIKVSARSRDGSEAYLKIVEFKEK